MTRMADFTSQSAIRVDAINRLRQLGPLVKAKVPIIGPVWMTTTQEMAGATRGGSADLAPLKRRPRAVAPPFADR